MLGTCLIQTIKVFTHFIDKNRIKLRKTTKRGILLGRCKRCHLLIIAIAQYRHPLTGGIGHLYGQFAVIMKGGKKQVGMCRKRHDDFVNGHTPEVNVPTIQQGLYFVSGHGSKKRKVYSVAVAIKQIMAWNRVANIGNRIDKMMRIGISVGLIGQF